jgi:hypothetical protein
VRASICDEAFQKTQPVHRINVHGHFARKPDDFFRAPVRVVRNSDDPSLCGLRECGLEIGQKIIPATVAGPLQMVGGATRIHGRFPARHVRRSAGGGRKSKEEKKNPRGSEHDGVPQEPEVGHAR